MLFKERFNSLLGRIKNRYFGKRAPLIFDQLYQQIEHPTFKQFSLETYGLPFSSFNVLNQNLYQAFLDQLAPLKGKKGLRGIDLGCGNGEITKRVWDQLGGELLGIDFAKETIEKGSLNHKGPKFKCLDLNHLHSSFPEGSLDYFFSIDGFYCLNDLESLLKKLNQVLISNGVGLIFFTAVVENQSELEKLKPEKTKLGKVLSKLNIPFEVFNFTEEELNLWRENKKALDKFEKEFIQNKLKLLFNVKKKETMRSGRLFENGLGVRYLYKISKNTLIH